MQSQIIAMLGTLGKKKNEKRKKTEKVRAKKTERKIE